MTKLIPILILFVLASCSSTENTTDNTNQSVVASPSVLQYEVVNTYLHDTSAYTQGLEFNTNGELIESTGLRGQSILHILDTKFTKTNRSVKLSASDFGEGTTLFNNKIYQLTWQEKKVLVYDAKTLKFIQELYWPYEGWGLTHNDTSLIVSTGGSNLYYVNPATFEIIKTIGVFNNYGYVSNINELEFIDGKIYANIYGQDNIIVIDPVSGQVTGNLDLTNILAKIGVVKDPKTIDGGYVLNGIAYNHSKKTIIITGKCWPKLIEIKLK
jgi:glutamine cyclotransferase